MLRRDPERDASDKRAKERTHFELVAANGSYGQWRAGWQAGRQASGVLAGVRRVGSRGGREAGQVRAEWIKRPRGVLGSAPGFGASSGEQREAKEGERKRGRRKVGGGR